MSALADHTTPDNDEGEDVRTCTCDACCAACGHIGCAPTPAPPLPTRAQLNSVGFFAGQLP